MRKLIFILAWLILVSPAYAQLTTTGVGGGFGSGAGVTCSSSEGNAFLARLTGSPDNTHKTAYCTLIDGLVTDGIFAKQDAIYIFATDATGNALLSLVSATYNGTATGAPTFTADAGYTGASGKYIDTNFNATTAGTPKFTLNSASAWAWSNTSAQSAGPVFGVVTGTNVTYILPRFTDDKFYGATNDGSFRNVASTDGTGMFAANRSGASATERYKNGASVGTNADGAAALQNTNLAILRGQTGAAFTGQVMAGGFGQTLTSTEHGNLYARVHTYLQTIAGIP